VSGTHAHVVTVHGHTPVHRLPARVKLAALVTFVLAVVATPGRQMWAFAIHALLVAGVLVFSEIPLSFFLRRVALEVPFVLFAVFLPFLGGGERLDVAGLALSVDGLWAAWTIVAKGTLGVSASVVVVATTEEAHLLRGLGELRVPKVMVAIAGFMMRYIEVVGGESRRMRIAMSARGYAPRRFGQARALAVAGGSLFIRAYERGERVHQAMLARGYSGEMPEIEKPEPAPHAWAVGMSIPAAAWLMALSAWVS
jgi:cobalt/nickel transport system permease protein